MAMLSEKISAVIEGQPVFPQSDRSLLIDAANNEVRVHGKRIPLRGQGFDLLLYLFLHARQVCKRSDIARQVFQVNNYDELPNDEKDLEINRMNAAIRRLREKIEDDPNDPLYILTEEGVGYRLMLSSDY
jgi:DNA-binding response OmpR family regulator